MKQRPATPKVPLISLFDPKEIKELQDLDSQQHQLIGSNLSHFIILNELGKGSYGIVYRVKSNIDKNIYVLKKINLANIKPQHQSNKSQYIAEALKEAQLLRKLKHPNIITYFMSFIEDDCLCIIMEYAEGGDLQKFIKEQKENHQFLSEEQVWKISKELTSALQHIHQNNIIHRDIKALNIFLTRDKHVKLGDLGVSKMFTSEIALHGTRVGTPLYLAPELVQHQPYDQKVDVWALGCVIFYLSALELPFQGDNLIALGYSIVNKPPKQLPPQYSYRNEIFIVGLTQFICKLLEKVPGLRPTILEVYNIFFDQRSGQIKDKALVFSKLPQTFIENPYQLEQQRQERPQTSNPATRNQLQEAEKQVKTRKQFYQHSNTQGGDYSRKLDHNKVTYNNQVSKVDQYYAQIQEEQQQLEKKEEKEFEKKPKESENEILETQKSKLRIENIKQNCHEEPYYSGRRLKIQQNEIELYLDEKILQISGNSHIQQPEQKIQQIRREQHDIKKNFNMQIRPLSSQARTYSLKNLVSKPKQQILLNSSVKEIKKFTINDIKANKDVELQLNFPQLSEECEKKLDCDTQLKNAVGQNLYIAKQDNQVNNAVQNSENQITRVQSAFLKLNQKPSLLQSQQQANQIVKHYTLKDLQEI